MRKITFFTALFLLLGMGACSTDADSDNSTPEANQIVGEWVLQSYLYNGKEFVPEECEAQLSVVFLDTGTATYTKYYEMEAEECVPFTYDEEWEYMGNNIYKFTEEDDEFYTVQMTLSNNNDILTVTDEDEEGTYRAVYKRV